MNANDSFKIESMIYDYIDEFKSLFLKGQKNISILDYSKNEALAMLLLARKKVVNVSEIAEYINAPLNTATGVIGRLEKKNVIERRRDLDDKRVVKIILTKDGESLIETEKKMVGYYVSEIYKVLTDEEKIMAINIINKVILVFNSENIQGNEESDKVKKIKRINIE